MFYLFIAILLASETVVDAILYTRRTSLHRVLVPNSTTFGKQQPIVNCTPPEGFLQLVRSASISDPTVVLVSSSHAFYTTDEGDDISLFAYDCIKQKHLIFLHLPKNAGTTLEDLGSEMGSESGVSWGRFELTGLQDMGDGQSCSKWHVPPSMLEGDNPYADSEVFCVTRDPWERMVSEYEFRIRTGHVHDSATCTQERFNAFVTSSLAELVAGPGRFAYDCHLLPQWEYVEGPDGHHWCTHTLPIEDLRSTFNSLMTKYGSPLRLKRHKKSNARVYCTGLDADLGELYSQPAKNIMRQVYAKDFAHLGDSLAH